MHRHFSTLTALIVTAAVSVAGCSQNRSQPSAETTAPNQLPTVVETTGDGTVVVQDQGQKVSVRLACVVPSGQTPAESSLLATLLPPGQAVQVRVISPGTEPIRAELFLGNRPVGLQLVEEGEAMVDPAVLTDCPETASRYWQAQIAAQQDRQGLWGQYDLRVATPIELAPNLTLPVQATAGNCPPSIDLWAFRWGFEGGADHTVRVDMREIAAQPPRLVQSSDTAVVFAAPVQSAYADCAGRARSEQMTMYSVNFQNGQVQFSLDLQGDGDRKVIYQGVSANRPYIYWQATE
ncbi:MAG TPA: thermonuclease family protein [Leptolyngbyaceae cyanobacterium]